ncbi:MAG: transglycosylase domain-containing protein [Oscillospiraceae bacterium]|nr:transglycosylase domain-containing protein [Oscillospiraceae bacterium]
MSNQENKDRKQTQLSPLRKSSASGTAGAFGKMFGRTFLTILVIVLAALGALGLGLTLYLNSYMNEELDIDLHNLKLNYTSFIYTTDKNGKVTKSETLYGGDNNRIWVDFDNIPQTMKDAMVAIEDKRFYEHDGVDWTRTLGAVSALSSSSGSFGGSPITQQLIKNLTGDNQVSINRKVKEIFRALNLEKKYSKDEILEAYLNVVDYGAGTKGVQAAANLYFNKNIADCDIAECAAIAGITQNPYAYNPLAFPEKNKERQQTVIQAMYDQKKITQDEYNQAMEKSENMKFYGKINGKDVGEASVFNWYTEALINDVIEDLQGLYQISEEEASRMIYYGGLKIYSAEDVALQKQAEKIFDKSDIFKADPDLEAGFYMMDYNGRVLTVIGSSHEKTGNRWMSNATDALRQVGSTMKPISVYTPAMENGFIGYNTTLSDDPIPAYFPDGTAGPNNWYAGSRGNMPVTKAIEISANRPAANLCNTITPQLCYKFMTEKLHFKNLTEEDSSSISSMALGGLTNGLTVKEMVAGFQIFGNSGKYSKPYTYYYVEDSEGNVILDNRNNKSEQAVSAGVAEVMNKILQMPITGSEGTGTDAAIDGWTVFGKTGTTDSNKDSWFMGGTPYAIAGIWTGYAEPSEIYSQTSLNAAKSLWRQIMTAYLEGKEQKDFNFDDITEATLCTSTGKIASSYCSGETGWVGKDRLENYCDGNHTLTRGGGDYDDEGDYDDDTDNEEPTESETGEGTDDPENPDTPESPDTPDTPDTPTDPDTPDTPATPDDPDNPVSPPITPIEPNAAGSQAA